MIRRKGTYDIDIRENMRGGAGKIQIEHFWKKEELKGKTRLCARLTLQPGASIGFHEHVGEEEIFVVARGTGRLRDGELQSTVEAGDTILTGDGAGHAIEAIGNEPLELIAIIVQY